MINVTDARKGITVELDNELYQVLEYEHIKMARGSATVRLKLKDVRGGHIIEKTFQNNAKLPHARIERLVGDLRWKARVQAEREE